ncbi:tRNA dimethylallyltransferase [hydrothermal vent metagenome]|uniref:tRNA dimethylallyltransferase n=1 Tax=hydrothermal vent metagenome TaxID=652676 RepID=A0A3B0TIZ4_9ZZZZ
MNSNKIIFIVGPTAIGKSDVAVSLAEKINGEIVSCDSMQIYKEIQISSNKPSAKMLQTVKHHLLDIASITEKFDVAMYNRMALEVIADIQSRQKIPIVVGGSGLYIQVLLDGIFEGSPRDEQLREALNQKVEDFGTEDLYEELKQKDPVVAQKIHFNDAKRIVRALEVIQTEKRPLSEIQKERNGLWDKCDVKYFGLTMDRKVLYEKINVRVDVMFKKGLFEEIKDLLDKPWSHTAAGLLSYKEIKGCVEGDYDFDEAKRLIKRNTRHYAKRQWTWFRRDQRIDWMTATHFKNSEAIAQRMKEQIL